MDKCSVHKEANILKYLEDKKVYVDLIPGGTTHLLQPLDTCVNKPFKDRLRKRFEQWFSNEGMKESNKTKKGFYKSPSFDTLAEWILKSWEDMDCNIIKKSFKYCGNTSIFHILILFLGLSNELNGSEDSMININLTKHDLIAQSMKDMNSLIKIL